MSGERDPEVYRHPFKATYTMFPDNAAAVDISSADATFPQARTIYVGSTGDVVVTPAAGGAALTFTIQSGGIVPVRVSSVTKIGTTATSLVSIW